AEKYAFDYWTIDGSQKDYHIGMDTLKAADYTKDTTFVVYFDKDEIGTNPQDPTNPNNPDGIPDKYQIVFTYKSEDLNKGGVNGILKEVQTRPKKADGSYDMKAAVKPKAEVTVSAVGNYRLDHWTGADTNYTNIEAIRGAGFTEDTAFVAYFKYYSSSNNNSSGGGGGSSNSIGRVSISTGGPGVTIPDADVPMAPLPEVIDDGEIPMAALPKTGQTSLKSTLAMMFSGILLVLTVVNKKRREEEN
ncbi:MAG: doubled motif LPXTG anchor domain-containing protein, partial [Enterocloster sp.]